MLGLNLVRVTMHTPTAKAAARGHVRLSYYLKQRILAAVMLVSLLANVVIPPASVYAALRQPSINPSAPAAHKNAAGSNKIPMKTNYAGPLPANTAPVAMAADASKNAMISKLTGGGSGAVNGEALFNAATTPTFTKHEITSKRTATSLSLIHI